MSEVAGDLSPGESIRGEALQVQHNQLREKLNAARWQLSACTRARDSISLEHATAAEEATQLEAKASTVRQEVISCGEQLRALNVGDGIRVVESGIEQASKDLFPLSQSLVEKNVFTERRIEEFEEEVERLRTHSNDECVRAQREEALLESEASTKIEWLTKHISQCEERINSSERSQYDLQRECSVRGEVLRAEVEAAELDAWREIHASRRHEQQAEAHLDEIGKERIELQSKLEESRLLAADATCLRARMRRVTRDMETRSANSNMEMQTASRVFKVLSEERDAVEKRLGAAETELAGMLANALSEEKRWDSEMDQVSEHKKMLDAKLRKGLQKEQFLRDEALKEEFEEVQQARFHLSRVEARSCVAQQGLSEALARLASSQKPAHGQSTGYAQMLQLPHLFVPSSIQPPPPSSHPPQNEIRDLLDKTRMVMQRTQDLTQLWKAPSPAPAPTLAGNVSAAAARRPLPPTLPMPQDV